MSDIFGKKATKVIQGMQTEIQRLDTKIKQLRFESKMKDAEIERLRKLIIERLQANYDEVT